MSSGKPDPLDPEDLENIRVGYQMAVNLFTFQSNLNWSRFNAMLTANSIIVAVIGITLQSAALPAGYLRWIQIGLPVVGLVLCLFWLVLMSRGNDYHRYWINQAMEFERRYFAKNFTTVLGAHSKDEKQKHIRFSWLSRTILGRTQNNTIYTVILVFAVLYILDLLAVFSM